MYFAFFLETKVSHLLRQVADGRIGACCIPDCMNGEVLEANSLAVEDFVLV